MTEPLRVALIAGPQYDQVDATLDAFTREHGVPVEVAFRGDHVALNRHLADALPGGARYHLVSTHSKYVPSQSAWLQPIDPWSAFVDIGTFHPTALDLCRYQGALLSLPRNIDARLLFVDRELVADDWEPASWDDLLAKAASVEDTTGTPGFAYPTRDSGLFGTFFELTAAFGGRLFDESDQPAFTDDGAVAALTWMVDVAENASPPGMVADGWYFDEISAAFRQAEVAMVGDWPGYYGLLGTVAGARDRTRITRYPPGTDGRRHVYAGCHGWAIPLDSPDPIASAMLLHHLSTADQARVDASAGMVPVRLDVAMPSNDALDRHRAQVLQLTIAEDLLTFPALPTYPAIEDDAAAPALRAALLGERSPIDALAQAEVAARAVTAD